MKKIVPISVLLIALLLLLGPEVHAQCFVLKELTCAQLVGDQDGDCTSAQCKIVEYEVPANAGGFIGSETRWALLCGGKGDYHLPFGHPDNNFMSQIPYPKWREGQKVKRDVSVTVMEHILFGDGTQSFGSGATKHCTEITKCTCGDWTGPDTEEADCGSEDTDEEGMPFTDTLPEGPLNLGCISAPGLF